MIVVYDWLRGEAVHLELDGSLSPGRCGSGTRVGVQDNVGRNAKVSNMAIWTLEGTGNAKKGESKVGRIRL